MAGDGDRGLAEVEPASEVRVDRRESTSSLAPLTRPFPKPLDCPERERGEVPIIAIRGAPSYVVGAVAISGVGMVVVADGPARPRAIYDNPGREEGQEDDFGATRGMRTNC